MKNIWALTIFLAGLVPLSGLAQDPVGGNSVVCFQGEQDDPMQARLRGFTPAFLMEEAARVGDGQGNPDRIRICYMTADLEATGRYDFVVALFEMITDGELRVFQERDGVLQLKSDPLQQYPVGGAGSQLELIDIENDGRPEISVSGSGASRGHFGRVLFAWRDSALVPLIGADSAVEDTALFDMEGDGTLELISPPYEDRDEDGQILRKFGKYEVYRFEGSSFVLASASDTDPRGSIAADGDLRTVFAYATQLTPFRFGQAEVQAAAACTEGVVTLRFGNLGLLGNRAAGREAASVNLESIRLGRGLRPIRVEVLPRADPASAETQGQDLFQGAYVQAQFSRCALLRFLPRAQFSRPVQAGDKVSVEVSGRMQDGADLSASVLVEITP